MKKLFGSRKEHAQNRYIEASRSHTALVAGALSGRFLLGFLAQACVLIALVAVGGALNLASKSKIEPYVFVLEKQTGLTYALGQAERLFDADASIRGKADRAALYQFFADQRLVTADSWLQDAAIKRVYKMVDQADPAYQQLQSWYLRKGEAAYERAASIMVHIEPIALLPLTQTTWQFDWLEIVTTRTGAPRQQIRMRATAEVYHREPTSETTVEEERVNPPSLFVRTFSITPLEM
jgi:type IV secretory pathway TrbF-like protein